MEQDWLNKVLSNLCEKYVDMVNDKATYQGFEVEPESNSPPEGFNSIQIYGKIIYKDGQGITRKSKPVFIKRAVDLFNRKLSISFAYINELNFYTKVVPVLSTLDSEFSSLFAKFYHGEIIFNFKENESTIILENLKSKGFRKAETIPSTPFLNLQHLMVMMRKIGQLHAYSYKAKTSIPDLFYPLANNCLESTPEVNKESFEIKGICGKRGLEHLQQDPAYAKYALKINQMLENAEDIFIQILTGDKDNPHSVMVHGDYMGHNVMFKYKNDIAIDMVMIDAATFRYGSPVLDLITILYFNADQETRDKYWDCLINEYYTALEDTFPQIEIPSKNQILLEFVDKSFYAYLIASYFLPLIMFSDDKKDLRINSISDYQKITVTREFAIEMRFKNDGMMVTQVLSDILKDMIDRGFICN